MSVSTSRLYGLKATSRSVCCDTNRLNRIFEEPRGSEKILVFMLCAEPITGTICMLSYKLDNYIWEAWARESRWYYNCRLSSVASRFCVSLYVMFALFLLFIVFAQSVSSRTGSIFDKVGRRTSVSPVSSIWEHCITVSFKNKQDEDVVTLPPADTALDIATPLYLCTLVQY